MLIYDRQLALV